MVAMDSGEGWMGGYCLMDIAFQFCKMKMVLEIGCTKMWTNLKLVNCTFINDYNSKLCAMYILPQFKKSNTEDKME